MYLQYIKDIQLHGKNIVKIYSNATIARYIGMFRLECPKDTYPYEGNYSTINKMRTYFSQRAENLWDKYYWTIYNSEPDHMSILVGLAPIGWSYIANIAHKKYNNMIVNHNRQNGIENDIYMCMLKQYMLNKENCDTNYTLKYQIQKIFMLRKMDMSVHHALKSVEKEELQFKLYKMSSKYLPDNISVPSCYNYINTPKCGRWIL